MYIYICIYKYIKKQNTLISMSSSLPAVIAVQKSLYSNSIIL